MSETKWTPGPWFWSLNRASKRLYLSARHMDTVMDVVKRATEAVMPFGSRVSLVLKADIRPGYSGELDAKIERLEAAIDDADGR